MTTDPRPLIQNCTIVGSSVGIKVTGNAGLRAEGLRFVGVDRPFDIDTTGRVDVSGTRISSGSSPGRLARSNTGGRGSSVGYTGGDGPPLPALCDDCGTIFPSRHYNIRTPRYYGFDNTDICPKCSNEKAKVANGLLDLSQATIRIIQAETLTHEMLAAINRAACRLVQGEATAEETVAALSAVSPALGNVLKSAFGISIGAATLIGFYFAVMTNHLAAVQEFFGQQSNHQKNYQIEHLCMEAFGEAAKCRITIEPLGQGDIIQGFSNENNDETVSATPLPKPKPAQAIRKNARVSLPENGPMPKLRPTGY